MPDFRLMLCLLWLSFPVLAEPAAISDQPHVPQDAHIAHTGSSADPLHLAGLFLLDPAPDRSDTDSSAPDQQRHALVIGVEDYTQIMTAMHAVSDADALGSVLERSGFAVTRVLDAGIDETEAALEQFFAGISPDDKVIIYLAGHGGVLQRDHVLLLQDTPAIDEGVSELQNHALGLDALRARVAESGAEPVAVIFDACREPLGPEPVLPQGGTGSVAAAWLLIFTSEIWRCPLDTTGQDDRGDHSIFMRAMLPFLSEPGISLQEAVILAYPQILRMSDGLGYPQRPVIVDKLSRGFHIDPAATPHRPPSPRVRSDR